VFRRAWGTVGGGAARDRITISELHRRRRRLRRWRRRRLQRSGTDSVAEAERSGLLALARPVVESRPPVAEATGRRMRAFDSRRATHRRSEADRMQAGLAANLQQVNTRLDLAQGYLVDSRKAAVLVASVGGGAPVCVADARRFTCQFARTATYR